MAKQKSEVYDTRGRGSEGIHTIMPTTVCAVLCWLIKACLFASLFPLRSSIFPTPAEAVGLHKPNRYDLNGKPCSERRPARVVSCPPFAVSVKMRASNDRYLSQAELEAECKRHIGTSPCGEGLKLFPDGVCRSCPLSHPELVDTDGDLWCQDAEGRNQLRFANPTDCLSSMRPENVVAAVGYQSVYRPCNSSSNPRKVSVERYYKGDDENDRLTMAKCFESHSYNDPNLRTDLQYKGSYSSYKFPLLSGERHGGQDPPFGFLQCPQPVAPVSYSTPAWWSVYGFYIGASILLICVATWKHVVETRAAVALGTLTDLWKVSHKDDIGAAAPPEILQVGYRDTWIGTAAYMLLWSMAIGLHVLLLVVALDSYGMWKDTLCMDPEVKRKCAGVKLDYLLGYPCASGCLFPWTWTTGTNPTWPYEHGPGGISSLLHVFALTWLIAIIVWVAMKALQHRVRSFFRTRCQLKDANVVMCSKAMEEEIRIEQDEASPVMKAVRSMENLRTRVFGEPKIVRNCAVKRDAHGRKFIEFECRRYCWDGTHFRLTEFVVGETHEKIRKQGLVGLSSEKALDIQAQIGYNEIRVDINNFIVDLAIEFFTYFYLYQLFVSWIWFGLFFYLTGLAIGVVIVLSGVYKVVVKRRAEFQVKRVTEHQTRVTVLRDNVWGSVDSRQLIPGDVIELEGQTPVCCDCVLVSGRCVADESSLTGEAMPVPKIALSCSSQTFNKDQQCDLKYILLAGTFIQSVSESCVSHEEDQETSVEEQKPRGNVEGGTRAVVIATGAYTTQGQLVRAILFPPPVSFKFDEHWKLTFVLLIFYCLVLVLMIEVLHEFDAVVFFYGAFTMAQIVSPLIPAVFVAGQSKASGRLRKRGIFCVNLHRTFAAGKIKIFCFDKTGTLTKRGLEFDGIRTFGPPDATDDSLMATCMGCCHELDLTERVRVPSTYTPQKREKLWRRLCGKEPEDPADDAGSRIVVGNEVDRRMFESSGFEIVEGVRPNFVVRRRETGCALEILRRLEFDRGTMTMSVIVEDMISQDRWVFCKGSYESIANMLTEVPVEFHSTTKELATKGYYVLAMAYRKYTGGVSWESPRSSIEADLTLLGILVFRNELKEDSSEVIQNLREGSIRPVVITGDNVLTAVNIARQATIVQGPRVLIGDLEEECTDESTASGRVEWRDAETDEILSLSGDMERQLKGGETELAVTGAAFDLLGGRMYELLPYTSIFARMKPEQKVRAVQLHMKRGITGMCGDGANDAGALRASHCGIALSSSSTEATIVAHFSTANSSLKVVPTLVSEGRNALSSAMAAFKQLLLVGQSLLGFKFCGYYFSVLPSQSWFLTTGCIISIGMAWATLQSRPARKMAPHRPTTRIIGLETLTSMTIQFLVNWLFAVLATVVLFQQDWFSCKEFDPKLADSAKWWSKGDNYEMLVLSTVGLFQIINTIAVMNFGFDYRVQWIRNYWPVILWLLFMAFATALVFDGPSWLSCVFHYNCGDQSLLRFWTDHLGRLNYHGEDIGAPPGCPCGAQIGNSDTCENEYIKCEAESYNQTYHHNIVPMHFRWVLFALVMSNSAVSIFAEGFIMNGPVRWYFRRRRRQQRPKTTGDIELTKKKTADLD